jgi:hypothetical protein
MRAALVFSFRVGRVQRVFIVHANPIGIYRSISIYFEYKYTAPVQGTPSIDLLAKPPRQRPLRLRRLLLHRAIHLIHARIKPMRRVVTHLPDLRLPVCRVLGDAFVGLTGRAGVVDLLLSDA